MRRLISPWRWSVPLCFGMTRSISRRRSRRSRGSRALRNAASAALYSGVRLAGMIACPQGSAILLRSMNTYVHPLGKTRLAKNTYGADFHLLSAGLIGHVTCSLRVCSHFTERDVVQGPSLSCPRGGLMKDISTILLASVFVLFSLIILISASSTPDRTSSTLDNDQQKSLGSWTPFRLQKIGYTEVLHTHSSRSFSWDPPLLFFIHLPSFRFLASSLILFFLFSIRFCFRRCLSPRRRLRSGKIVKIVGVILHAYGINQNLYFVHHKWSKRKVSDSIAEFPDTNNNGAHVHRGRHGQCLSCQ